jgi:hypothetical protein
MAKFLRPNKASLKNAQHYEFIDAFITVLTAAGVRQAVERYAETLSGHAGPQER